MDRHMQHSVFHTIAFLAFSCLAISTLASWCCKFMSRIFSVPAHFASSCQISWRSVNPLLKYRDFCDFQDGGRRHLGFQKFEILMAEQLKGAICVIRPNIIKIGQTVAEIWRFNDFFKWWPSAILDLLGAYWDHPRWLLCVAFRYTKFRWNRCSSFDNMKLSILFICLFSLKTRIPKIGGGWGVSPTKWGAISNKLPKGTLLRKSASFESSSVKIRRRV